ncbi:MAG: hypothetical protein A2Y77_13950 [Planctomycetes bacterium RBG_13_62_9]|nr:MAG: hypothetical protein A2Y77_13950 [Planctomycetes bacterium RBG_13_62_9]
MTIVVQAAKADGAKLKDWVRQNAVPFPAGMIRGDESKVRLAWGVKSLPWLTLTDAQHVVRAEGFNVSEIDRVCERIK